MSLRLIKPGLSVAGLPIHPTLRHPKTGEPLVALGVTTRGPIWPALGASSDDEDDPDYTGGSDDEKDDEDDEKDTSKKDDEDDDEKPVYTKAQYDKIVRRMKAADRRADETDKRLRSLEDKDKPADELAKREAEEAKSKVDTLTRDNQELRLQVAFLTANQIQWHDPEDALAMADLSEVEIGEDGTVDRKSLRAALKDLAKRKPHLVKKSEEKSSTKDDDDDKDEEGSTGQRSSGSSMNRKRKGDKPPTDRASLAKRFPVLGR